jgi:hypothetical protein
VQFKNKIVPLQKTKLYMTLVSSKEFTANQKKYFGMAKYEKT